MLFHDGELIYAQVADLRFDLPVLEADIVNLDSNSERAILPLAAIRQIIVGASQPAPSRDQLREWDRAAFHFLDGQVLRAFVGPDTMLGAHGGIWPVVEPDTDELRTLAVPYTSLKGVFRLRQWDGRSMNERSLRGAGQAGHLEQTVRILAEREARANGGSPQRPSSRLLERGGLGLGAAEAADLTGREPVG